MGLYVKHENLENFLKEKTTFLNVGEQSNMKYQEVPEDSFLVCMVANLTFKAAGVVDCEQIFNVYSSEDDRRKIWFLCKKEIIKPYCPKWDFYLKN